VLLEKKRVGSGATGVTTGFLTQAIDTDFQDLIKMLGDENTKKVLESHGKAIDLVEKIIEDEHIECEFVRTPTYLYAANEEEYEYLEKEAQVLRTLGADIELGREPLGYHHTGYLKFNNQAKFHALKFLAAVAKAAEREGAELYQDSKADKLNENPLSVESNGSIVTADCVISATYSPFEEPRSLFLKKGMYITYIEELRVPKGYLAEGMYEDLANPYHYFRVDPQKGYDRIIVGGEDHRADIKVRPTKNIKALEDYCRLTFRDIPYEIVRKWRGGILEPIDGLAFIGPVGGSNTLYAFGFSGSGMTYAPIAALMFRDFVAGRRNEWRELYDASRMPGARALMVKGKDYMSELVHGALKNSLTYRKHS
jgi:glycine/D-amino acid oxidase-like deaminating enzyme